MDAFENSQTASYLSKLGGLILAWSHYETSINVTIEQIYENWNGEDIDPIMPLISLNRKIKFLRRWYRDNSDFHSAYPWVPNQLDALKSSSKIRDIVIHGVMLTEDPDNITKASFHIYSADSARKRNNHVSLNEKQLWVLGKIFISGAYIWGGFARLLEGAFDNPDDFDSKVGKHFTAMFTLLQELGDTQD